MSRRHFQQSLLLICLLLPASAAGDVLHLAEGSVLHGRIISLSRDSLEVKTSFAGIVAIDPSLIAGLSTEAPAMIALADGTRMEGLLVYRLEQDTQHFQPLSAERISISPEEIASITTLTEMPLAAANAGESAPAETATDQSAAAQDAAPPSPAANWSLNNAFGMSGSNGNTDRVSFNGHTTAKYETPESRLNLSLRARFAREDGAETENEIISRGRYERDFSERWFAFGTIELERDEFEDLDLRSVLTAGTGVFVIKTEKQELKLRGGAGYQRQDFMNAPTENEGILSTGFDYVIALNSWLKFTHEFTILPLVSDPLEDFRIESDAGLDIPVSNDKAWRVRLGLRNHFNNQPVAGNEELDTFYTVSLAYDIQ